MNRWLITAGVGLLTAIFVLWIDLPFTDFVYSAFHRFRGAQETNARIWIAEWNEDEVGSDWKPVLKGFLDRLGKQGVDSVFLDFKLTPEEQNALGLTARPFRVFWRSMPPSPSAETGWTPEIHLAGLPSQLGTATEMRVLDGSGVARFLAHLDDHAEHPPKVALKGLIHVAGPPGTFSRLEISRDGLNLKLPEDVSTLLIAPPKDKQEVYFYTLPLFPKNGVSGSTATEAFANFVISVVNAKTIRLAPEMYSMVLAVLVSIVTVLLLFLTTPILGIFTVVLVAFFLIILGIACLDALVFLDLSKPLFSIAFVYYFLIPYRLIVEYKGRWQYQKENKLLSEVETLKDNFMSLISHNLKTPVARIVGAVETLKTKTELPSSAQEDLDRILLSTEELNRFLSRVLTLTRIEDPDYQIQVNQMDINPLVEEVVRAHQPFASDKSLRIDTDFEPLFPVLMDPDLIRESISNLLENAIKYTPEGGKITVRTKESSNWVQVQITDTGPGISEEDRDKIFSKFFRGKEIKNKKIRGSGLGLYLVRYFVELHGGNVDVVPNPEGGTTFTLSLLQK